MKVKLTLVITAANDAQIIKQLLTSVNWIDEIVVIISNNSIDDTFKICQKYTKKVFITTNHLGFQRRFGINKATNKWILLLDSDEFVSDQLKEEIIEVIKQNKFNAYKIPYQNYFLKHKVYYGNQKYDKIRLFQKKFVYINFYKIHPEIKVKVNIGKLNGFIHHHSFRSIPQVLKKFTYYASVEAPLLYKKGERVTLKKLTMYPAHMFYSIFFKDQGYKDGIWGFGLATSFTYLEFMKYFLLLIIQFKRLLSFRYTQDKLARNDKMKDSRLDRE